MGELSVYESGGEAGVDIATRLISLEGRYNLLRERMFVVNRNMIEGYKKLSSEIKMVNSELSEIKNELASLKEAVKHVIKEMQLLARKDDVKVLEKYINFWNPLKFVTEKEVIELIKKNAQ